jgi:hypothetical protein
MGGTDPALKKTVQQLEKSVEQNATLFALSFQTQVKADRHAGAGLITDAMILQSAEVITYPAWSNKGVPYVVGDILTSEGGLLFEVIAPHTSNKAYPIETTFAYYRLIELEHAGTLEDPIPYPETAGILVDVRSGLHYAYKGGLYIAKADMPNCVYPPNTPSMWQWEAVEL